MAMEDYINRPYRVMQPSASGRTRLADPLVDLTTGQTAGAVTPAMDPFAGLKAGETRQVGSFTGQQTGGMTVIRGQTNNELDRLRTQGASIPEAANAVAAQAASLLDTTNARLRPAESAATVANTTAAAKLLGEQAKFFGPTAQANIALTNANVGQTNAQKRLIGTQADALYNTDVKAFAAPSDDTTRALIQHLLSGGSLLDRTGR